uniref:DacH n=1 Tax=Dactylosporangium sp. SC14051 TaxID=1239282 RepID=K4I6B2_9ACTN|nr:DacH [Dactylosporangium sp. SC14051]
MSAAYVTAGPPIRGTLDGLLGGPGVADLLTRAAHRDPDRVALRCGARQYTFAGLDDAVSRCAAVLRGLTAPGSVVAVAGVLDPAFAVGFLGAIRAGHVSAQVNPLLHEEALRHVLALSEATTAIVTPRMYRRLAGSRDWLPRLRRIILTHRDAEPAGDAVPTLWELMRDAPAGSPPGDADPDAVACLQFTSGTTGPARAVRLSHRNLTVNAAQTAHGHRLSDTSVLFNFLPTFHLMHLTIGLTAGATHVLWPDDDVAGAVRGAAGCGATHFYSLPVRLIRLARDERLPGLRIPGLRAVLSGGSAVPPEVTEALQRHFAVPVTQGFGLAETSPSTHLGHLERPRTGSCGPPVPGTECRIVDVDTGRALPPGGVGEIQVRGPQLMLGYLGRDRSRDVDPDGWFATGDVGRVDEDGYLYVVDRIKDVFKCDNWLVSPSEIEATLRTHPAVADCVVFDHPDPDSGAVAHALAVVTDPAADPAGLMSFVNERQPYYAHLKDVELVDAIPRSATGKVQRRALRDAALERRRTR